METGTAAATEVEARPATMAAMASWCAKKYGDTPALRFKRDGDWQEISYAEMGEAAREIAAGLISLGVEAGDRVCILGNTRPEWSLCDLGIASAGAVSVPIYPTNSPEECEWVAGNSEAKAVICEDVDQVDEDPRGAGEPSRPREHRRRSTRRRSRNGPSPSTTSAISGADGDGAAVEQRVAGVKPEDAYTFVYTSGTTGPPKGCVLSHGNWSAVCDMIREIAAVQAGDISYLYLPLAHVFARVVQLCTFDLGATLAFFGGDTRQIVPELADAKPTYFPVGAAHVREDLHAGDRAGPGGAAGAAGAVPQGGQAGRQGARDGAARGGGAREAPQGRSSRRTRRSSRRCARSSAARCARRPPAPPRSRPTSSSSSTPAECRCSRDTA